MDKPKVKNKRTYSTNSEIEHSNEPIQVLYELISLLKSVDISSEELTYNEFGMLGSNGKRILY